MSKGVQFLGRTWQKFPRMIVFDVDYTLWPPPYQKGADGKVTDGSGDTINLFPETAKILLELAAIKETEIAYASRTGQPQWLKDLAQLMPIGDGSMWDLPDYTEIYPGSKLKHFKRLEANSGVPTKDMLFFDDEPYSNMEVTSLGVTFVDATGGITGEMLIAGLEEFASTR
eukprot:gene19158-12810_t